VLTVTTCSPTTRPNPAWSPSAGRPSKSA